MNSSTMLAIIYLGVFVVGAVLGIAAAMVPPQYVLPLLFMLGAIIGMLFLQIARRTRRIVDTDEYKQWVKENQP